MEDEDFIPPTDGTVVETKNKNSFVPPSDAVELKKKEYTESTSTTQNGSGDLAKKDGFSDSQKASLGNFKVDSADLQNASIGNKSKTLDIPKEADLTMRKVQLEKQIATKPQDRKDFKQNPKYASAKEELHDVNNKLQQVKEVENQKNAQLDSSIENAIFTVDDNKIKSAIDSEVNDNEISDYAREGGKNVLNVLGGIANIAPKTINALSGGKLDLPTYEPFEKKIPFEKATKQVNGEIKEAKKKDPNLEVTPEEFNKRVKDVFVEQQKQNQYQENASKLLADADPQVQERIKAKYINEIGGLDKSAKANSVLIQALDNKATPLRKELLATKQLIDSGKADPTVVADFNSKLENYNQMEQQYAKLVSEQEKNSNKKLTAEDRLKLFRLDYNPYSKAIDDLTAPTAKMIGDLTYGIGKADDFVADITGGQKSGITEAGDSLIKSAEEVTARHQNNKFSDIDSFGRLGSWATQTVGTVAPYVLGSGIGTTEEQALSKAFLTPSKALGGFSVASAGGAMNEMDTEMANNPDVKYNNWQYAGKVLGSVGANAIMFGNYGNMLKGNKALFESISKTPEANVEFQKGVKDYLDSALKVGKGMNKSGAVMMGSQAINMFVDNHILGKKHEDGFDELANAYIEGSAMHGLISEVPNLASFMIEKVLPNGAKKEINQNLKKGYGLVKELENPDLTPDEKSVIQTQIDAVHKDNERLLKASNKVVEGFTHNQVKELLKIDQDKFAITKDVEDIKNGNYSKEYKQNALNEKKAEFNALETRRQDVFENEHNALTLLSKSEQNRLEKEAKTRIAEKEGKEIADVKFEPKEVNDTALRIHKTELKEQAVKDAEAKIPTSETKSKAEVPQQAEAEKVAEFPLKEGETLVETKQDNKGRTFNTVAITTEKEGLKKTKFLFNRSDKPSDQRNLSSISPEKLSSDFGFEISKDDVPEGFEVTRVKEIRETDKGSAATVTIKDTESDESWDAEIVITKTKETPETKSEAEVQEPTETSKEIKDIDTGYIKNNYTGESNFYHGTTKSFDKFEKVIKAGQDSEPTEQPIFLSEDKSFADAYAIGKDAKTLEVKVKDGKFFDFRKDIFNNDDSLTVLGEKIRDAVDSGEIDLSNTRFNDYDGDKVLNSKLSTGDYDFIERKAFTDWLKKEGYDGAFIKEHNSEKATNLAVWNTDKLDIKKPIVNEAQAQGDNLPNGEIRPTVEPSGESTVTEQQVIEPKSVPEAVEPKSSQGNVEIEHNGIVYSKNENGTWTNTKSGNEVKGIGEKGKALIETLNSNEVNKIESDKISVEKTEIQKEPTRQERVVEKKKIVDAKIDDFANALKELLPKGFDTEGLKKNGFSQDELIDIVAKGAKALAGTGIEINEAVRQVIEKLKEHFEDFSISEKDVLDKHFAEPMITDKDGNEYTSLKKAVYGGESKTDVSEKESGTEKVNKPFEGEQGKSSILKRISEGGNSAEVNKTVEDIGLNYAVRKQDQVYADAVNFVNKVGIVEAYNAIKNNLIQFGDSVSVIYAEIVDRLPAEIEKELSKVTDVSEREKLQKEYNDLQEKIYSEFSARAIDLGQANSILNYIYNKNTAVKYSLANQIKEFKNINSGEIDAETLDKFKKLDKEYKEAIAKIADLEKIVQEANEQKDFENIVEEETRPKANKPSKKKTAENAIKALDKFEKSLLKNTYSDATLITPILIQGVRLTKASIKAGMAVSEAVEKGIEQIKKEIEKLGKTFDSEDKFRKDLQDALGEAVVKEDKVTVDKNGNLKIPMNIIKDYISKGGTDLAELSEQIHETIKDEFPNIDVRDIREKIAGIGKNSNKTKTQLETDITNLKRVERLKLELEDLQEGIAKAKNPVRKQKLSSTEKKLKAQIKALQDALGITEEQRTQNSINYTKRRISEIKEKIENRDYSKKEIKPIEENAELKQLKIEKNRIQEEFDTAKYKKELENRSAKDRIKDFAGDMWDSQRVTRATGELSFVGAQGGFYMVDSTFSRKTLKKLVENFKGTTIEDWKKSPMKTLAKIVKSAHSAESIIEMFNKMGTKNNYDDFQKALKEHPNYDLFLKSGLRVLGEDVKTQVKDEMFIGNHLLNILKLPFRGITHLDKGTKRTTLQGYYEKLKTGKVSEKNKKNVSEMFDAVNPLSVFERGNNTFINMARVEMFEQGAEILKMQGKNPIDHIQDYKDLASAVNTVTGSANLNQTMTMAVPILNKLIFSTRFWASSLNMMSPITPYYLLKLGNYENITANPKSWKNFRPSVAQKTFVKPMVKGMVAFYGLATLTVALINGAIDDDDELTDAEKKQKKAYIEYDPRSSDFMQVVSGNTRTDYFGNTRSNVVLFSKLFSRQTKKQSGEIIDNGTEFGSKTNFDIFANYVSNKANPFVGMFIQNMKGHREDVTNEKTGKVEQRVVNGFDNEDLDIRNQTINNMLPIFYDTTKDILEEDPPLGSAFYITMSALGKQTSVYNGQIDKFVKEQNDRAKEPTFEETFEKARKSDMSKYTTNINLLEDLVMAKNLGLTQYISEKGEKIPLKNMNWDLVSEAIEKQKELKEKTKNFPMPKQKVKSPD